MRTGQIANLGLHHGLLLAVMKRHVPSPRLHDRPPFACDSVPPGRTLHRSLPVRGAKIRQHARTLGAVCMFVLAYTTGGCPPATAQTFTLFAVPANRAPGAITAGPD